jgi:tRNA-dihydrouridine synthase A
LTIVLNGGLTTLDAACEVLAPNGDATLDGVMLGRAAIDSPYMLADVDRRIFGDPTPVRDRAAVVGDYLVYAAAAVQRGARPAIVVRPLVGLFKGCAGARGWRQAVTRVAQGESGLAVLGPLAADLATAGVLAA